jgi:acetyl/propionyl-CoA carboxylase alpha subunit
LEKALLHPRHIEVQIFADSHGQCVYLGERDCSIQRRHQKVVEEAPAAGLSDELRKTLGETAVTAALSANYLGAGTVEFLVQDDAFYFLEMNTRLQVEHPVTERVFGEDLVAWQIAIAEGGPLPKSQTQLQVDGHAIEVRLYAEDPGHGFLPQTGTAHHWRCQNQAHMRTDHMLYDGAQIGNWYDPMLAKLIAWGPTRAEAIQQLNQQLHDTALLGVTHNLGFLTRIIQHPVFQSAPPDTGFLARQQLTEPAGAPHRGLVVAEVLAFLTAQTPTTDWLRGLAHLSLPHTRTWQAGDKIYRVQLDATRWHIGELRIAIDAGQPLTVSRIHYAGHSLRLHLEGRQLTAYAIQRGRRVFVQCNGDHSDYEAQNPLQTTTETPTSDGLSAPMSGQVVAILAADQTTVCAGDTLLVLEAMKMELSVKAHAPGRLTLQCQVGDQVTQGTALARIDPLDEHTAPLQSNPTEAHHDNA